MDGVSRFQRKKAQRRAAKAGIRLNPYRYDTWPAAKVRPAKPVQPSLLMLPTLQQVQTAERSRLRHA